MKKLFFITIILLLQSFPSFGKWVEYKQYYKFTTYIEEDSITKRGHLVYVNLLDDLLRPNPYKGNLSSFSRVIINCKDLTYKLIKTIEYKRSMGRGEIVEETTFPPNLKFIDLLTDSYWRDIRNKICE